jgi:hypothetical protein
MMQVLLGLAGSVGGALLGWYLYHNLSYVKLKQAAGVASVGVVGLVIAAVIGMVLFVLITQALSGNLVLERR